MSIMNLQYARTRRRGIVRSSDPHTPDSFICGKALSWHRLLCSNIYSRPSRRRRMRFTARLCSVLAIAAALASQPARAAQIDVAVAANFTDAAKEIAAAFRAKTGHDAILSFGSSGQLYAQITQE